MICGIFNKLGFDRKFIEQVPLISFLKFLLKASKCQNCFITRQNFTIYVIIYKFICANTWKHPYVAPSLKVDLTLSQTISGFYVLTKEDFPPAFSPFFHNLFLTYQRQKSLKEHSICCLQMLSNWSGQGRNFVVW